MIYFVVGYCVIGCLTGWFWWWMMAGENEPAYFFAGFIFWPSVVGFGVIMFALYILFWIGVCLMLLFYYITHPIRCIRGHR